jgi:hypothetical protein
LALRGPIKHCFGIGQEGSHEAKNNASKAAKNCVYLIDIIALL